MVENKNLSRTKTSATKGLGAAFTILKNNGKEMPMRDFMDKIEQEIVSIYLRKQPVQC